jgi:small GTP-binding protein
MATTLAKIQEIEAEMARTQKNKATNAHLGMLKAKVAKLKRELVDGVKGSGGGGGEGFDVRASGNARVGLLGFPSVGKSTLMSKLTGTHSEAAAYEFTTLTCVPGTIRYKGAKIQLLDLPGIIEGAKDGKGRGKQVIGVARTCHLILIVLDALKPLTHRKKIEYELEGFGIRLNKKPANITLTKTDKGGISLTSTCNMPPEYTTEIVTSVLREYRINNASISVRDPKATIDDLVDLVQGGVVYTPCLYVLNKVDAITIEELDLLDKVPHYVPISAHHTWNFDELLEKVWEYCDMIRIYTKPKGAIPDYDEPVILSQSRRSIGDLCDSLHKTIRANFKYAWVWGSSVKHSPQKVGIAHVLEDEDIVQLVKG